MLSHVFRLLKPFRALVLGDFLLDAYTTGRVKRVSPEAPVPILEVLKQESRPGGAGNSALNLAALGGKVLAIGRIGSDKAGQELLEALETKGIDAAGLFMQMGYQTPIKNRLIADSQQLLRVDLETLSPLSPEVEERAISVLQKVIPTVQVLAISDYGKGFLSNHLLNAAIEAANLASVPVIIDPKGIDFSKYFGATLVKPNLAEAYSAAKLSPSATLDEVAKQILAISQAKWLLITRSEEGMSLFDKQGNRTDFPVRSREVKDVTGAGDTVLATLSLAMAIGLDLRVAVQLANIAAGIAIERLGCVQVHIGEIAERLLKTDGETKIFEENQLYALQQVLKIKPYTLLVLEKHQTMTKHLYRVIRELSFNQTRELILYVQGAHPEDEFIHFLASMHDVDAILLQKENLEHLCKEIAPQEVFYLDGEETREGKERLASILARTMVPPPRQRSPS